MKLKRFSLLLADALFFSGIYVLCLKLLNRPPVNLTVALLFVLYAGVYWFFRFYNLEIFSNRALSFSRILRANIVVTMIFWGLWWFALKTEWPEASRLLLLFMIGIYGLIYSLTLRQILGRFLLKHTFSCTALSPDFQLFFEEEFGNCFKNVRSLGSDFIEKEEVRGGFLFFNYQTDKKITSRAEMWQDYFSQIKKLKDFAVKNKVKVFVFNPYNLELKNDASVVVLNGIPALEISGNSFFIYRRMVKPLLDRLIALLMLPVLVLFHPLAAVLIRWTFGSPVVFRQIRLGKGGKKFGLYKYRTMKIVSGTRDDDVDDVHREYILSLLREEETAQFNLERLVPAAVRIRKLQNRKEISMAGGLFRKASLDELPQILNVLRGEMSLVGPRPILPYEMGMFPDWSRARIECPQGVTGLWQVAGRGVMPQHTSLFLDSYYALEYHFYLDVLITFKTFGSVFVFSRVY